MARNRLMVSIVLIFLVTFSSSLQGQEEEKTGSDLHAFLSDQTLLYLSIPSLQNTWENFQTLPLYKAYQDEEVQAFIESLGQGMDQWVPGLQRDTINQFLSLPAVFPGEIAFALIPPDKEQEDWSYVLYAWGTPSKVKPFIEKALSPFFQGLFSWGPEIETLGEFEVRTFFGPARTLCLADHNGQVFVTESKERLMELLSKKAGSAGSLGQKDSFSQALLRQETKETSFFLYLNLEKAWKELLLEMNDEEEKEAFTLSGFLALHALCASLSMAQGRAHDHIWLEIPEQRAGLLELFSQEPVDIALSRLAPANTLALAAGNLRIASLYQTVVAMDKASSGEFLGEGVDSGEKISKELTLRSFSDIIESLGMEVALFGALPKGGGFLPEAAAAIEVLEPDKLQTTLFSLTQTLTGEEPKTLPYLKRQIHYIPFQRRSLFEISMCWCVTDGYLLVSYHPTILKGVVKRLHKSTGSLREDPEFEATWKGLPSEAVAVCYVNSQRLFNYIYNLYLTIASMVGDDLPFDSAMLPTAESVASYLSFALSGITLEDKGIRIVTTSDGYGPTSMALYGLIAALFWIPLGDWRDSVKDYPSCGSRQHQIYEALEEYRKNNQRYPSSFREMIGDGDNRPWFTNCPKASSDPDYERDSLKVLDFDYLVEVKEMKPPESFPDSWMIVWDSEPRHNKGRVILMGDGEVTWLPEAVFQERLREQEP